VRPAPAHLSCPSCGTSIPPLLTPAEVMTQLRLPKTTFYRLVSSGELPAYKVGNQLRITRDAYARFLDERRTR
jgi:excisionase family DNA binding protein